MVDIGKIPLPFLHTLLKLVAITDHTALDHLAQKVVALTGTLADTGEHRESVMTLGDIVDELLYEHGLAHTGTTEQTDLTTFGIGFQKVDHLDTGIEDFLRYSQVVE